MNIRFSISSLLLLAGTLLIVFIPFPSFQRGSKERIIEVEATMFEFTPSSFKVNQGDRVTIKLISSDVVHGLYIDGYDVDISADPGQTSSISFTADQRGSFRILCSITCGSLHPFMVGKFRVGPNLLLWRGTGLSIIAVLGIVFRKDHGIS